MAIGDEAFDASEAEGRGNANDGSDCSRLLNVNQKIANLFATDAHELNQIFIYVHLWQKLDFE